MKLLPKDEIAKQQASAKAQEIAEGLKISRRVDGLRELAAGEEQKLELYRTETLASIEKEIRALDEEKGKLLESVGELREEKERGLTDVAIRENALSARIEEINAREESLREQEAAIIDTQEQARSLMDNAEKRDARSVLVADEAERLRAEVRKEKRATSQTLSEAQESKQKALSFRETMERTFAERERVLQSREDQVSVREETCRNTEETLSTERLRIIDREATLERALKRLNKQTI